MKIHSYMIAIAILLLTFSTAANKAIADLGHLEIDDLFYNSGVPSINGEIEKFEFDQVDKILIKNEDLELESLEIADIDLATFGEYESFLNKYYDDNYVQINSKFVKQLEVNLSTISGVTFPFSQNIASRYSSGTSFGLIYNSKLKFNIKNISSHITLEGSVTNLPTNDIYFSDLKMMKFNLGVSSQLINLFNSKSDSESNHNLNSQVSLGIINSSANHSTWYKDEELSNWGLIGNVDLTYIYDFAYLSAGIKCRAQSILIGTLSPPSIGNGTNELFQINFILSKPLYLVY